ncbi:hypothetical protein OROGR_004558 [Orobanche gracilis]
MHNSIHAQELMAISKNYGHHSTQIKTEVEKWDHEKKTISASEEWWNNKIKENPLYKQFKEEGIEPGLESKMDQLFNVSIAQGAQRFTPVQRGNDDNNYIPSPSLDMNVGDVWLVTDDGTNEDNASNINNTEEEWCDVFSDDDMSPTNFDVRHVTEPSVTKTGSKRVAKARRRNDLEC